MSFEMVAYHVRWIVGDHIAAAVAEVVAEPVLVEVSEAHIGGGPADTRHEYADIARTRELSP